jgi:glyoxylase I family protein
MGSSFVLGLAATSATGSMTHAQPIPQRYKGEEPSGEDSTCKRRIQGPGFYHVGLFTTDMDATIRFYTEGFGFTRRYVWNKTRATEPLPTGEFIVLEFNIELLDLGDGNYLEVIGAGKPANELVGDYGLPLQHLALRVADTDAAYARAVAAGAKPHYFNLDNNVVWDGQPLNFVIKSINDDPPVNLRIGWVTGPNNEVIELVRNDVL